MSQATISLVALGVVVVLFVWNKVPVEVVAIGSALALYFLGVLDLPQALSGFGDPTVVLIASLFVVSEGLDASGVTAWIGQALLRVSSSPRGLRTRGWASSASPNSPSSVSRWWRPASS